MYGKSICHNKTFEWNRRKCIVFAVEILYISHPNLKVIYTVNVQFIDSSILFILLNP